VNRRELQQSMYELVDPSKAQRVTLTVGTAVWVVLAWWLLFGRGIEVTGGWIGRGWHSGDVVRRACLAAAFTIYFIRILFTEFVFLKRGVSWSEVFTILPWVLCIYVVLGISGGRNAHSLGAFGFLGAGMFVLGSWMNSYAEYARNVWKQHPENCGRLYTQGLFAVSRHPNYLGDLISFSGLCLISGAWFTAAIPILMLCGFVFVNIPILDSHLQDKYGAEFDEYAKRTRKLIPFVY
jgi:steroid 5-alpha reductase family enzyme